VRTNNLMALCLSIAMGGAAAYLARSWLQSHAAPSTVGASVGRIVVAAHPLSFGVALNPDNLMEIPWAAQEVPEGAFVSTAALLKDGPRVVLSALDRNEPVLRSKITGAGQRASLSLLLEPGKRAVTVRVDDVRGVAGFILPGDFVDVVLISEDPAAKRESYSEVLLHHVKVLAIDQLTSERPEHPTVAKAVTVEVTPEQAQKVLLATNIGRLSLVLRQPGDESVASDRRVTERDLNRNLIAAPVAVLPRPPPPVPAPPPPVVKLSGTVTVAIVRGTKREEYNVRSAAEIGAEKRGQVPRATTTSKKVRRQTPQRDGLIGGKFIEHGHKTLVALISSELGASSQVKLSQRDREHNQPDVLAAPHDPIGNSEKSYAPQGFSRLVQRLSGSDWS
jgi:pilus assembly protein CpaB